MNLRFSFVLSRGHEFADKQSSPPQFFFGSNFQERYELEWGPPARARDICARPVASPKGRAILTCDPITKRCSHSTRPTPTPPATLPADPPHVQRRASTSQPTRDLVVAVAPESRAPLPHAEKDVVVVVALSRRRRQHGRPIRPLPLPSAAARAVSVARPGSPRLAAARPQVPPPPGRPWPWPPRAHRRLLSLLAVPRRRRRGRGPQHRRQRHPGHTHTALGACLPYRLVHGPFLRFRSILGSCLGGGITYVRTY